MLLLLLALVLSAACGGASYRERSTPEPTALPAGSDAPAPRDLVALAVRLRGATSPPRSVQLAPLAAGDVLQLNVIDLPVTADEPPLPRSISATVRAVSDHAYFLFQDGGEDVDDAEVQEGMRAFEETIWPAVTEVFGTPAIPGVDGDPRVVILHGRLSPGIGGYVNGDDAYPSQLVAHSNQREMVYINLSVRPLGSGGYNRVVAHELQHLVHQAHDGDNETWINEGLSEIAADLAAGRTGYASFFDQPDLQLNAWGDDDAHYGASALFFDYLLEQTGGDAGRLAREPGYGSEGVRAFLRGIGTTRTFEEVVADWAVANLLDQPEGPYGYAGRDPDQPDTDAVSFAGPHEGSVAQFAADYLELDAGTFSGPLTFTFEGDAQVSALAAQRSAAGAFWWSGRGDDLDSTLTRELDLTGVTTATLTFRTWFDIERWFDFGYVEVSSDGGRTWRVLEGEQTAADDPLGVTYGPAYSGRSGGGAEPAWVDERIDLSAFAGERVLLRFELINDDGTNMAGWAIDDIAVPETGFSDDAEGDAPGWQRQGFRRLAAELPQRFALRLVTMGDTPQVQDYPLSDQNMVNVHLSGLGSEYQRAVFVVVALTDGTTERAGYRYDVIEGGTP